MSSTIYVIRDKGMPCKVLADLALAALNAAPPPPGQEPHPAAGKGGEGPDEDKVRARARLFWHAAPDSDSTVTTMAAFARSECQPLRLRVAELEAEVQAVTADRERVRGLFNSANAELASVTREKDEAKRRLKIFEDELARSSCFPKGWKPPVETNVYVSSDTGHDRPTVTFSNTKPGKPKPRPSKRGAGRGGRGKGKR